MPVEAVLHALMLVEAVLHTVMMIKLNAGT
jgi:hypothetical protein